MTQLSEAAVTDSLGPAKAINYPAALQANYMLGLLFLAYVLSFIDRQVLGVLIGPIKSDLQITDFQFSLLQGAAFAILYSFMALPFGRLADSKSRKVIIGTGIFFWSLMTIGCGMAKNFSQLFMMRMGVGVGEAALSPAAYSSITDSFTKDKLTGAMAIFKGGIVAGAGLAFVLGGALYEFYAGIDDLSLPLLGSVSAWQATFVSVGLPGFVLAALILMTKEPERKGFLASEKGQAGLALSLPKVLSYFAIEHRRLYGSLFIGCSLLAIVSYGYTSWFAEMLIRNFDLTRSQAGAQFGSVYIISGLLGVMSGPLLVKFFQKRGHIDANMRALLTISIFMFPTSVLAPLMPERVWALALAGGTLFFLASYVGVSAAALQMVTPNQLRGQATAIYIFSTSILGLALGSSMVAAVTDFVFADELALKYSISLVSLCILPFATWQFKRGLKAFSVAIVRSDEWS